MSKILVAEDDAFLQNAYRVKLSKADHDFRICSNGDEVIKTLTDFIPDVILLDLMMPIKDGFTTLSELKANQVWKNIPVIIASNLGQKEDIDKGMGLGAVDYIVKSNTSISDIMQKIENTISKK